ncbi:MAG: hypothetical protein KGM15_05655 [Pseudomonadota bacterium]|nr:hypothetical protein [Pseudomonadota bacterium]
MADVSGIDFINLLDAVLDLLKALNLFAYSQGTMEAALVEAQGATWVGGGAANHAKALSDQLVFMTRTENAVRTAVEVIRLQNPAAGARLKDILQTNVFARTSNIRAALSQTLTSANSLRQTDPSRLSGVTFFEGGAGSNVARTVNSLPSEQLKTMALRSQLAPGVEPTVMPSAAQAEQQTMSLIRQMPVTADDIKNNIKTITGGFIAAVRLWVSQFLSNLSAALRLAMIAAEEALVAFGSRLTTPFIIIGHPWGEPIEA